MGWAVRQGASGAVRRISAVSAAVFFCGRPDERGGRIFAGHFTLATRRGQPTVGSVHLLRVDLSRRSAAVRCQGGAGIRQHFERWLVRRQRRLETTPSANRDARHRERSLGAAYDQYWFDGGDLSRGKSGGAGSTQRTKRADGAVRAD